MLKYSVLFCILIVTVSGQSQNYRDQSSHRGQSLSSVDQQLASDGVSGQSQNYGDQSSHRGQSLSSMNEQLASEGVSGQSQNYRDQSSPRGQSLSSVAQQLASDGVSGQSQNYRDQSLHRGQSLSLVDQQLALQGVSAGLANSASSKPCRRRNNANNPDLLSPAARWVQKLNSQSVYPLNQKVSDEADENLGKGTSRPSNGPKVSNQQGQNTKVQKDTYKYLDLNLDVNETPLALLNSDIEDLLDNEDELCQNFDENESSAERDYEQNNLNADSIHASNNKAQKQALETLAKCVQKEKYSNDDESEGNSRRSNNDLNYNKPAENSYAYEPSNSNEEKRTRKFRNKNLNSNEVQVQPKHPAQGEGISSLAESRGVLLLHNSRVCFACTTTNDPSCWNPDHTTTVKYCKKEDDACITKTYKAKNELITVRDCGNSCTDSDFPGVPLRYKSCRICHSDQCNSADALTSLNMLLVAFFITAVKFTL